MPGLLDARPGHGDLGPSTVFALLHSTWTGLIALWHRQVGLLFVGAGFCDSGLSSLAAKLPAAGPDAFGLWP